MSAIFMRRHRFSTINPDDIARVGGRLSLNSISFKPISENVEELEGDRGEDDEKEIVGAEEGRRKRRSTTGGGSSDKRRPLKWWRKCHIKWTGLSQRYGLNHMAPILLLLLYSILGAVLFSLVELPSAQEKREELLEKIMRNRRWAADSLVRTLNLPDDNRTYTIILDILKKSDRNNSLPPVETITWDIWGALFYVGTLYTTIGYGNIYPTTNFGYALTIVYAFFGVPLVLAILSDIGQLLAKWSSILWRSLMFRLPGCLQKPKTETDLLIPDSGVPVTLCLMLTFSWLLMVAGLFCLWERNWSYFTSFYFFFISLSTIGLGDVVPDEPNLMLCNFGLVIIGLCLVSMTLGVVQEHIALFLYRMMIQLQKECEAMLANGEDVERSELLEKMWDKQPWYMRKLMPAFINEGETKRLEEFAGEAITDTAVQMGIIPPPPNYRPGLTPTLASGRMMANVQPPAQSGKVARAMPEAASMLAAPLAMIGDMQPKSVVLQTPQIQQGSASPRLLSPNLSNQRHLFPVTSQNRLPTMEDLYPGGKVVVRRSHSLRLSKNLSSLSEGDVKQKLEHAMNRRVASTQTVCEIYDRPSSSIFVQTDLAGPDIFGTAKKDTVSTVSLSSWFEEDEIVPFSFNQLERMTAEEIQRIPGMAAILQRTCSMGPKSDRDECGVQTDAMSMSSSSESDSEFVSALDTRPLIPPPPLRFLSKFVQTVVPFPEKQSSRSQPTCHAEVQTIRPSCQNTEIQTSAVQRSNAEIQCQPQPMQDQEIQTSIIIDQQGVQFPRPDLLPDKCPSDTIMHQSTQTLFQIQHSEKEAQTVDVRTKNEEMQTETVGQESVECQVDTIASDGASKLRVRIQGDSSVEEEGSKEESVVSPVGQAGWKYSSWISNGDRKDSLGSLPEEKEDEGDLGQEELGSIGEESDTDLIDLYDLTDDSETQTTSEGIYLPAVTIKLENPEEGTDDIADDGRKLSRTSKRSRLESILKAEIITAEIATQTEEIITRRQSFPRDQFTSQVKRVRDIFKEDMSEQKRPSWISWLTHRKQPGKGSSERIDQKTNRKISTVDIGIQTESRAEVVRDILIQTDDSYLLRARKFENLRSHRTKSIAVTVAPNLKQRLNKMADTVTGQTSVAKSPEPGEGSKGKKGTGPRKK